MPIAWCRQTFALFRKCMLVKVRSPILLAVEALAPIVLSLLLLMLFSMSTNLYSIPVPVGTGDPYLLKDASFFRRFQGVSDESNDHLRAYSRLPSPLDVYYSICCSCADPDQAKDIISKAFGDGFAASFLPDAGEAPKTCRFSKCLAVVIFSECSLNWNYTIRMPSEAVPNSSLTIASVPSSAADPLKVGGSGGYRNTRVASYLVNGFVSLQAAINRQILFRANTTTSWNTQPLVTAFTPFTQEQVDAKDAAALAKRKAEAMRGIVRQASGPIVAFVLSPMVYFLGAEVAVEREMRVRDTLKIMGMHDSAYYTSMFLSSLVVLSPSLIIISGIFVAAIFSSVDYLAFFWIFAQFACACLPLPFISSLFVKSPSWAGLAAIGPLILLIVFAIIITVVTSLSESNRIPASLLSLVGVQQSFDIICAYQAKAFETNQSLAKIDLSLSLAEGGAAAASYSNMCLLDACLYWLMFLYLEQVFPGEQGVARPWHFIFSTPWRFVFGQKPLASTRKMPLNLEHSMENQHTLANFEPAAEGSICSVETQNLTKIFPALRRLDMPKVAVNNLSMKMYEGQILALLGHNSAGKSTTLSMLTGCLEPTSGSVLLRGPNGMQDTKYGRVPIGFCPQYDVLWPKLSVYETLCVYAQIKGVPISTMHAAIHEMIAALEMTGKLDYPTGSLSGGQKRRLCVANALIGDCKIIFLDEPTSGMDPFSRRALWSLIKQYQPGRCIVFTTHYMDEADILGDRVAVLSHGSLKVSGSPLFLKRRFGCGYTLSVLLPQIGTVDTKKCVEKVMTTVRLHVPSASIVMQEGQEVILNLDASSFASFPRLLLSLDECRAGSEIRDYGISLTTLDEVFMRIEDDGLAKQPPAAAVEQHNSTHSIAVSVQDDSTSAAQGRDDTQCALETPVAELGEPTPFRRRKTFDRAQQRFGSDSMDVEVLQKAYVPVHPSPDGASFWSQFQGIFVKRFIAFKRDISVATFSFILPIAIAIGASAIMQQIPLLTCDNPDMIYSTSLSLDMSVLYSAKIPSTPYFVAPVDEKFATSSNFFVEPDASKVKLSYSTIPSSFAISTSALTVAIDRNRSSVPGALAACCSDLKTASSGLNAFYNSALLHSLPSTLAIAYSSLLFAVNGGSITCQSWPLPQENTEVFTAEGGRSVNGNLYGTMFLAVSVAIALGSFIVCPVAEMANRSKFLQTVSGVRSDAYWAATFLFDFGLWTFFTIMYMIVLQIFKVAPFTGSTAFALWVLMLVSGAATIVMVYCWSFKMTTPSGAIGGAIAVLMIVSVPLLVGWMSSTIIIIVNGLPMSTAAKLTVPAYIGIAFVAVFPPLSMIIGSALLANMIKVLCSMGMKADSGALFFQIFVAVNCFHVVFYGIVLLLQEAKSKQTVTHPLRRNPDDASALACFLECDADVRAEHEQVITGERDGDYVVAKCIRQEFSSPKSGRVKVAVAGISLSVKKGEVLGILGPNGAGKTSTLSILNTDHMPFSGSCTIHGHGATNLDRVRRSIGVCPQHDALFMHLTPTENIYLYARLRGIPQHKISQVCSNLLGLVKMETFAHTLCGKLSGGNKRKISLVVALIGAPPVIFMDEPSSGMDIIAKRFFWRVIEALRKEHAIILTTHSMEEAESVCSRVGIIVDGRMKCLGSLQRIKSVYGTGYDVQLKPGHLGQVPLCRQFMKTHLPDSILVEEHGVCLKYTVPHASVSSVSFIFETVSKLSQDISMSEFGVCQTSLEQVFLHFGKQQRILSGADELEVTSHFDIKAYNSPFDVEASSSCVGVFARGFLFFVIGLGVAPVIMGLVIAVFLFTFVIPFPVGRMFLRLIAVQLSPLDRQFCSGPLTEDRRVRRICNTLNILFFFCGGGFLVFFHILMAFALFASIVGYKFAFVHLDLLKLVIAPYGRHILAADAPIVSSLSWWQIFNYGRGVFPCCCCDPKLSQHEPTFDTLLSNAQAQNHSTTGPVLAVSTSQVPSHVYASESPFAEAFMVGASPRPPPVPPKPARLIGQTAGI